MREVLKWSLESNVKKNSSEIWEALGTLYSCAFTYPNLQPSIRSLVSSGCILVLVELKILVVSPQSSGQLNNAVTWDFAMHRIAHLW
jgi:hypothetical protein